MSGFCNQVFQAAPFIISSVSCENRMTYTMCWKCHIITPHRESLYTTERGHFVHSFGQTACEDINDKFLGETAVTLWVMVSNSQDHFYIPACDICLEDDPGSWNLDMQRRGPGAVLVDFSLSASHISLGLDLIPNIVGSQLPAWLIAAACFTLIGRTVQRQGFPGRLHVGRYQSGEEVSIFVGMLLRRSKHQTNGRLC